MSQPRGRAVIITGAGKGLGRAYALALASHGANVLVNNRRHPGEKDSETSAMSTVLAIRELGGSAEPNYEDITNPSSGEALIADAIAYFGGVDAIVANAGIEQVDRFENLSLDAFMQVFSTSFFGNLYLVKAAWAHWLTSGSGRAVLTTSGAGLYGNHGQSAYSAAKAAILGLTKTLALEGASRDIKVNALAPYAYTAMTSNYLDSEDANLLAPEKVAPLVNYLVSAECSISGEILVAAGGALRAAHTIEEVPLPLEADVEATIALLKKQKKQYYGFANESFLGLRSALTVMTNSAEDRDISSHKTR